MDHFSNLDLVIFNFPVFGTKIYFAGICLVMYTYLELCYLESSTILKCLLFSLWQKGTLFISKAINVDFVYFERSNILLH